MMWRSLLFVPVLNERLIEGAARRDADAIVLDLEAAVPQTRKNEEARAFCRRPSLILRLLVAILLFASIHYIWEE